VRLFTFLNGLAGRSDFADAALRFFYVGAVPLMAMLLAAMLVFRPHAARLSLPRGAASRWKVAFATALAVVFSLLLAGAVNAFAWRFLGAEILSPRPFVIHRTTLLIVEPNDNSFPSPETMVAGALAVALWAVFPPLALPALMAVVLLCLVRVACGTNYPADVFAGALAGSALGVLMLALCRISLQLPRADGKSLVWRARPQALCASLTLLGLLVFSLLSLSGSPRYGDAVRALLQSPTSFMETPARASLASMGASTREAHTPTHDATAHEGEGAPTTAAEAAGAFVTRDLPPAGQTLMGGYLPQDEKFLLMQLQREKLPHRLVSVDVAQVRAGTQPYRAAAVRFEVARSGGSERRAVLTTAARIVRAAFRSDAQLQNIDVTAVVLNDPRRGVATLPVFAVGAIPVFTASVARRNLIVRDKPWVDVPGVDDGLWLRARSRLYINANVLPAADAPPPSPLPTRTPEPTASPMPTLSPTPTVSPTPTASPLPTAAPTPSPTASPTPGVTASPTRAPFVAPRPQATTPSATSTRAAPSSAAQAAAQQKAREAAAARRREVATQKALQARERAALQRAATAKAAAQKEAARRNAARQAADEHAEQQSRVRREKQTVRPRARPRRRTYQRRFYRRRSGASTRRSYRRGTRWRTRRDFSGRRYRRYNY
jgi:membrane-associated phospholipid phosphatase